MATKRSGTVIKNWQIHNLTIDQKNIEEAYPGMKVKPMVFTGTVVEDPTGRWLPGYHMRSSLIVKINKKRTKIETINTIYTVQNEGKDLIPDLGNNVFKIFY